MDGLTAVEQIMSSRPMPILVLSAHVGQGSDKAAAALAAGALDAIAKEDLDLTDPAGAQGAALRRRAGILARAKVIRHPRANLKPRPRQGAPARSASVIGICASTGGPQVLAAVLAELPAAYPIPILIVQHIAAGFTGSLARWLDQSVPLLVRVARNGAEAAPGAWIAPDGAHLRLSVTGQLALDRDTVAGQHRPSGDILLASIASVAGPAGVAVVLTGMGADGAAGAAEVHRRGGFIIAQDEASSAVYGMPKAAAALGVDAILPPAGIAASLLRLTRCPLPGGTRSWTG
jgi:two-component system, chemotaxis family, protein-glutamate methylesterase/glutaminase